MLSQMCHVIGWRRGPEARYSSGEMRIVGEVGGGGDGGVGIETRDETGGGDRGMGGDTSVETGVVISVKFSNGLSLN